MSEKPKKSKKQEEEKEEVTHSEAIGIKKKDGGGHNRTVSKAQKLKSSSLVESIDDDVPLQAGGHSLSSRKKALYKTELCRSTEETGECPYGPKCQFAHTLNELRVLDRHPRYKTEMCKTYWQHGTCPYGK
jgi:hypothetical protein